MRTLLLLLALLTLNAPAHAFDLGNRALDKPVDNSVYTPPTEPPRQGGDTIEEAIPITIPGTYVGTTIGYQNNYDEMCPYGSGGPDVVYTYMPDSTINLDFDLCYSTFDTVLYIYDVNLNLIACSDDFHFSSPCYTYTSKLENIFLQAGMTYYVIVDGYGASAGPYQLDITENMPCVVTCPTGAHMEDEPPLVDGYLDAHNGGCNSPEFGNPFQPITEPVFCGVSGWYLSSSGGQLRDTDWFHIVVPASGVLEVTGDAEFPTSMFELFPQICGSVGVVQNVIIGPCNEAAMTIVGAPGSLVWFWVGPTTFTGPANEYHYILHLNLDAPVQTERHSWTNVKSLFN